MQRFLLLALIIFLNACQSSPSVSHASSPEDQNTDSVKEEATGEMTESKKPDTVNQETPDQDPPLSDLIRLNDPTATDTVLSPILLKGQARGYWFFEGDFPVTLEDAEGNILARSIAMAQGEWMTRDWVDFEVSIKYEVEKGQAVYAVFHKQNASGDPAQQRSFKLPLTLVPGP